MTSTDPSRSSRGVIRSMFRGAFLPGVFGVVALPVLFWAYADEAAALSALVGAAAVFLVLMIGLLAITAVVFGDTATSMAGAGVVYLGQLILLVAIMAILSRAGWVEGRSFAVAAIIETLAMQIGQIIGYLRAPQPAPAVTDEAQAR